MNFNLKRSYELLTSNCCEIVCYEIWLKQVTTFAYLPDVLNSSCLDTLPHSRRDQVDREINVRLHFLLKAQNGAIVFAAKNFAQCDSKRSKSVKFERRGSSSGARQDVLTLTSRRWTELKLQDKTVQTSGQCCQNKICFCEAANALEGGGSETCSWSRFVG